MMFLANTKKRDNVIIGWIWYISTPFSIIDIRRERDR